MQTQAHGLDSEIYPCNSRYQLVSLLGSGSLRLHSRFPSPSHNRQCCHDDKTYPSAIQALGLERYSLLCQKPCSIHYLIWQLTFPLPRPKPRTISTSQNVSSTTGHSSDSDTRTRSNDPSELRRPEVRRPQWHDLPGGLYYRRNGWKKIGRICPVSIPAETEGFEIAYEAMEGSKAPEC